MFISKKKTHFTSRFTKSLIKAIFFSILFLAVLQPVLAHDEHPQGSHKATIYYNEACSGCGGYLRGELIPLLEKKGARVTVRDYIAQPGVRKQMTEDIVHMHVPLAMQGHIVTFVDRNLVLSGHVPISIVSDLLEEENQKKFERMVVFQDVMHGEVKSYTVWAGKGEIKEYSINTPISEYLNWFSQNQDRLTTPKELLGEDNKIGNLLPIVLVSGFLDGLNPCAFAVLIFFIAFLFTLRKSLGNIFVFGLVYIIVIYLTYLGIGLGLFKAILLTGEPHFMARIGSYLMIVLGLVNIKDAILPKLPIHLQIPKFSQPTLKAWLTKATLPGVIIAAFLVGLCTFPCSGGIYVAVVGLLAAKTTFFAGLLYLLIYNVMFVVPLLILLVLAANPLVLSRVGEMENKSEEKLKLWLGIFMVLLGIVFLVFLV